MSKSRAKGTFMESLIRDYLISEGFDADRTPLAGSKDVGDLKIYGVNAVFEIKNCVKIELSKWVKETEQERINANKKYGFTIFKRKGVGKPEQQYALMPLEQLVGLLKDAYSTAVTPTVPL